MAIRDLVPLFGFSGCFWRFPALRLAPFNTGASALYPARLANILQTKNAMRLR